MVRNRPPALPEWGTKAVRDAIFASPQFPRLLFPQAIRETIANGVAQGLFGYGVRSAGEAFLRFDEAMRSEEVEITDETFIVPAEEARRRFQGRESEWS